MGSQEVSEENPYWLGPFENYETFVSYLVGDYVRFGVEMARYVSVEFKTFIQDIPPSQKELRHRSTAFDLAWELQS